MINSNRETRETIAPLAIHLATVTETGTNTLNYWSYGLTTWPQEPVHRNAFVSNDASLHGTFFVECQHVTSNERRDS